MEKSALNQRIETLKTQFEGLRNNLDLSAKKQKHSELTKQMSASDFWSNQAKAQKTSQEVSHLESFLSVWESFESRVVDLGELLEISEGTELLEIEKEIIRHEAQIQQGETEILLGGEYDNYGAIVSINTGTGGQDAEDFSQMLSRMYLRFGETKKFKITILEQSNSDVGLKSIMFSVSGPFAYGLLKGEHGVHRLIRLSPFNAKSLRQTSFSRVEVMPEIEQDTDIEIDESDLRIDVFRASGNGGQSVNTTDSAVRITYLPLNLVVNCQNEKSQLQNKAAAMKVLKSRLLQLKLEQNAQELSEIRGSMMENSFGSQIRTYTLQPYKLVKDHRTDTEHNNPDKVLDGDLDVFMQAFLRK